MGILTLHLKQATFWTKKNIVQNAPANIEITTVELPNEDPEITVELPNEDPENTVELENTICVKIYSETQTELPMCPNVDSEMQTDLPMCPNVESEAQTDLSMQNIYMFELNETYLQAKIYTMESIQLSAVVWR